MSAAPPLPKPSLPAASPAASPWYEAIVERVVPVTPRTVGVFLRASSSSSPSSATFPSLAGQHLVVRLTAPDGYAAQRSYSIASAPGADRFELLIEKLEDGEVSPFFHDIVEAGDVIEVRGPLGGHFVWCAADGGPLLLVAGGSGIAPLMAMVRDWQRSPSTPLLLVYSARTWDELALRDELIALQARVPEFTFIAATTRGIGQRPGDLDRRLDDAALLDILQRWGHAPRHAYVCGANRFVEAVAGGLLAAQVPAAAIRTERYGGAG